MTGGRGWVLPLGNGEGLILLEFALAGLLSLDLILELKLIRSELLGYNQGILSVCED